MKITFRQLEVFMMTAKWENMSRAANDLYLSQSACSMALAALEEELGGELFDRHNKKLVLNERGKMMFAQASNIIQQVQELRNLMQMKQSAVLTGSLNVGSSTTIGNYILPAIVTEFMRLHKQTKINLKVGNTSQITQQLLNFDIDIGFIEGSCHISEVDVISWKQDELIIVISPTHPLVLKKKVTLQDLKKEKWIYREKGSGTRESLEKVMGKNLIPYVELGHTEAIKQAVAAGLGISCISKASVEKALKQRELLEFKIHPFPLKRNFYAILHKQKYQSLLQHKFMQFAGVLKTAS